MSEADAIQLAMAFVETHIGVVERPDSVRYIDRGVGCRYWSVTYMPGAFFAKDAKAGSTIDGPYVIHVDDNTGTVSVLG